MKPVEALQTAGAWRAAIVGSVPQGAEALAALGGGVTDIPWQLGVRLEQAQAKVLTILSTLQGGAPGSVIGLVVEAIKYVVGAIVGAAEARERNWAEARCAYIAQARGMQLAEHLRGVQGCTHGRWSYPRASLAKDRCVPYYDWLPKFGTIPSWVVPARWQTGLVLGLPPWPKCGVSLGKSCTDWALINLDTGATDCKPVSSEIPVLTWPWAYPLISPARLTGWRGQSSVGPEDVMASLYAVPTPQHIFTRERDVVDCEEVLLLAMQRWYPDAYLAAPGDWRRTAQDEGFALTGPFVGNTSPETPDLGYPVGFAAFRAALARVDAFWTCRMAVRAAPGLLPSTLQDLLKQNPGDFKHPPLSRPATAPGPGESKAPGVGGLKAVATPPRGGGASGGALLAGGAALWLMGVL